MKKVLQVLLATFFRWRKWSQLVKGNFKPRPAWFQSQHSIHNFLLPLICLFVRNRCLRTLWQGHNLTIIFTLHKGEIHNQEVQWQHRKHRFREKLVNSVYEDESSSPKTTMLTYAYRNDLHWTKKTIHYVMLSLKKKPVLIKLINPT